jgi:deazaflavin-dependent oxidoreductase (nitroreductase family)
MSDYNTKVIEEFRANGGKVGNFANMVLVHHKGAKSGTKRVSPLAGLFDGDNVVVFASFAGAPNDPAWFVNLMANPQTVVEVGTEAGAETWPVTARVAEGAERERLWAAQKAALPIFSEYETKTDRKIPVVVLERR